MAGTLLDWDYRIGSYRSLSYRSSIAGIARSAKNLVTLKNQKKAASSEYLFHLYANGRARQKGHRFMEDLEWAVAVGDAETGDIEGALVLQFTACAGVIDGIKKSRPLPAGSRFETIARANPG